MKYLYIGWSWFWTPFVILFGTLFAIVYYFAYGSEELDVLYRKVIQALNHRSIK